MHDNDIGQTIEINGADGPEVISVIINPERLIDEPFEDYRLRRRFNNALLRDYLRGRLAWNSKTQGTYKRQFDGGVV